MSVSFEENRKAAFGPQADIGPPHKSPSLTANYVIPDRKKPVPAALRQLSIRPTIFPPSASIPEPRGASSSLTLATAPHEDLDPITAIQSFYLLVEAVARARGNDPDKQRHLSKVTSTR